MFKGQSYKAFPVFHDYGVYSWRRGKWFLCPTNDDDHSVTHTSTAQQIIQTLFTDRQQTWKRNRWRNTSCFLVSLSEFCFISFSLTCTQNIFSEERKAKKSSQDCKCGAYSRKGFRKSVTVCAEAWERSTTHDAMGVTTQNIVLIGIQFSSLYQLKE